MDYDMHESEMSKIAFRIAINMLEKGNIFDAIKMMNRMDDIDRDALTELLDEIGEQ